MSYGGEEVTVRFTLPYGFNIEHDADVDSAAEVARDTVSQFLKGKRRQRTEDKWRTSVEVTDQDWDNRW